MFWDDIEEAIKIRAVKVLYVLSQTSNTKDGPLKGLDLNASDIIRSEETSTRSVRYRFNANVTWVHWPPQDGEGLIADLHIPPICPSQPSSAPRNQVGT